MKDFKCASHLTFSLNKFYDDLRFLKALRNPAGEEESAYLVKKSESAGDVFRHELGNAIEMARGLGEDAVQVISVYNTGKKFVVGNSVGLDRNDSLQVARLRTQHRTPVGSLTLADVKKARADLCDKKAPVTILARLNRAANNKFTPQ